MAHYIKVHKDWLGGIPDKESKEADKLGWIWNKAALCWCAEVNSIHVGSIDDAVSDNNENKEED